MAKLGSYYGLCPLIDQKSLLGVTEDDEEGTVVVTLGKNIAIKHKLSNQKQLHSWRTKDKFTSPVIYDKEQSKYVAAFNYTYLRLWTQEDEHLDKLKKLKFHSQMHTILSCGGKSFVIFKNGNIHVLKDAIDLRKSLEHQQVTNNPSDDIIDVLYTHSGEDIYIGLIIKVNNQYNLKWTVYNPISGMRNHCVIALIKDHCELTGYAFHHQDRIIYFLTLWSDGKLLADVLNSENTSTKSSGIFISFMESINCKPPVSIVSLDEDYIALYGSDNHEEGARLLMFNLRFKVVQSKLPLKLFTKGAQLWCIGKNLILPIGQNLAVIPFNLDPEQLAALVGSHKIIEVDEQPDVSIVQELTIANWGKGNEQKVKDLPEAFKTRISGLCQQGLPENSIMERFIPHILEKHDMNLISYILKCFSDIPEKMLVQFIKIILNAKSEQFNVINIKDKIVVPPKYLPLGRIHLLDKILNKSFSSVLILPFLRSVLDLDEVKILIEYIHFMLSNDGHGFPETTISQTEQKILKWACILLDANFQKIILSSDENIKELLANLRDLVDGRLELLNELNDFSVRFESLFKHESLHENHANVNAMYTIELINLY